MLANEDQAKKKKPVSSEEVKQKRNNLWEMMEMAKKNDQILNGSKETSAELGSNLDNLENLLKTASQYLKEQVKQKSIVLKREEEQKRRIEKEKKKEQERQREEKRKQEEERKKEEQRKRLAKIAFFKKQSEQAVARLKLFEQQINKLAETKPQDQSFETLLLSIDNKRQQFDKLEEKRKSKHKQLQAIKQMGNEIAHNFPINPDLPQIAERISKQISALYLVQEQAYQNARSAKTNIIKQVSHAVQIPTDHRIYNPNNFYQLEITQLQQQSYSKIEALPLKQRENERTRVQTLFGKLKLQQKFINQLKIFIELYQVEEEVLSLNRFDLSRYKQLLARKAQLMSQNRRGQQFDKIDQELNKMTNKLNTGAFLMPFKYPLDLLVKAKDHLVKEYVQKQIKELQSSVHQQQETTKRLQEALAELKGKLQAKREEKKAAQLNLEQFLQAQKESFNKALQELPRDKQENESIELVNREELLGLYLQKRDHQNVNKTSEILQGRREKRAALQKEYEQLHQMLLNTPLEIEEYIVFTAPLQEGHPQSAQEKQMVELLRISDEIQYRKANQRKSEGQSNLGRYSSIFI